MALPDFIDSTRSTVEINHVKNLRVLQSIIIVFLVRYGLSLILAEETSCLTTSMESLLNEHKVVLGLLVSTMADKRI